MRYRREIDGLRALAVVPVILFHAGVSAFGGGYVGVDVFFVISGYLITGIILTEAEQGRFSILRFYERRARRILPALFTVMAVCLPLAWLLLLPTDARDFSASLVAVSLFSSNVLFWLQSGYFDAAAELRPLLHTWSLAVEEQYYLVFPWLMVALAGWGRRRLSGVLAALALLSLLCAQWGSTHWPSANFFMLHARAWELLIGALAAIHLAGPQASRQPRWLAELGGLLGLSLVGVAIFWFDGATPFPSLYALVPTIGAVLIILCATPATLVGRALGHRLPVGIGLISYSAYLWHQPLFAFARHRSLVPPDGSVYLALSAATLVLAYLSWRFVEQPFRMRDRIDRGAVFRIAGWGSLAFIAVGLAGFLSHGAASWTDERARLYEVERRLAPVYGLDRSCREFNTSDKCRTGDRPELLVWGDSYAMHLVPGVRAVRPDLQVVQMTMPVCGPFLGIAPVNAGFSLGAAAECIRHNDAVIDWLKKTPGIKTVVLGSTYGQFLNHGAKVMLRDGRVVDGKAHAAQAFTDTLAELRALGVRPVVVSPTPRDGSDIGRCLAKSIQWRIDAGACDFAREPAEKRQREVLDFLSALAPATEVVWLFDTICDQKRCNAAIGDVLLYRDTGHLSVEGSVKVALTGELRNALAPGR